MTSKGDHKKVLQPVEPVGRSRAKRGITLLDLAKIAGVSPMSASRALNTPDQVSEKILQKVRAAASDTGYVANRLAGGLASQRSRLVAAVIPSIAGPVFQDMVQSLIASLAESRYQLMLGQSGYGTPREDDLLKAIIGQRPDGIVLGGVVPSEAGRLQLLASGIPVVETWDMVESPIDMVVGFSHDEIAVAVAEYLLSRGRRRLAFVGGDHARARRRALSFSSAAFDKKRPAARRAKSVHIEAMPAPATMRGGREALGRLLKLQPDTDAVFCSSDLIALGVMTEAQARGLRVPADLAIIGFGDLHFAADVSPALSTVHIDGTAIGAIAGRLIIDRSEGRDIAQPIVDIGFSIITREST
ncbi:MAG: LacI family DNA-binding transcriptional regulator [Pseudomonadota bacterium]